MYDVSNFARNSMFIIVAWKCISIYWDLGQQKYSRFLVLLPVADYTRSVTLSRIDFMYCCNC